MMRYVTVRRATMLETWLAVVFAVLVLSCSSTPEGRLQEMKKQFMTLFNEGNYVEAKPLAEELVDAIATPSTPTTK